MGLSIRDSILGLLSCFLTRLNEIMYLKGLARCWVINKHVLKYQVLSQEGEREKEGNERRL